MALRATSQLILLHEGDLLRCFRNSTSVTYVSTLPSVSSFLVCLVPYVHLALSAWHLIHSSSSPCVEKSGGGTFIGQVRQVRQVRQVGRLPWSTRRVLLGEILREVFGEMK